MPVNDKQKVILVDIVPNTITLIEDKLALGYVIQFMLNLQPKYDKLLIVYSTPDII